MMTNKFLRGKSSLILELPLMISLISNATNTTIHDNAKIMTIHETLNHSDPPSFVANNVGEITPMKHNIYKTSRPK